MASLHFNGTFEFFRLVQRVYGELGRGLTFLRDSGHEGNSRFQESFGL